MNPVLIPDWREKVVYSSKVPRPQPLIQTPRLKSVLVGMEQGQSILVHPGPAAVYHFLEGTGLMLVDGEAIAVGAGATVIVPDGAERGVVAHTRLAFLGTHSGDQ